MEFSLDVSLSLFGGEAERIVLGVSSLGGLVFLGSLSVGVLSDFSVNLGEELLN